ncbi:MAG: HEAT repeat domain-containing protein [Phycisphaerae bacterium]
MNMMMSGMMMMVLALGGASVPNEALDIVPAERYWKMQNVEMTEAEMVAVLKADDEKKDVPDISGLIKQLGAKSYKARQEAQRKIEACGPGVLPQVRPLLKSDDAEVASRAAEIIEKLAGGADSRELRRLMAIRTLGNLKAKDHLPLLKKIAGSKDPFEAEYAKQAIAKIQDKEFTRPALSYKQRMAELKYLPENTGLIAQIDLSGGPGEPVDFAQLKKSMANMGPGGNVEQQFEQGIGEMLEHVLPVLATTGNARIDSVTIGVASDVGNRSGNAIVQFCGLYDPQKLADGIKQIGGNNIAIGDYKGVRALIIERDDGYLLLPSNDRAVLVMGANKEFITRGADEALGLLKGKGKSALDNEKLVGMIKNVDSGSKKWVVLDMVDGLQKEAEKFGAFGTVVAQVRPHPKKKDYQQIHVEAVPRDAADKKCMEQVGQAVQELKTGLAQTRQMMNMMAARMPGMKPLAELLDSVEIEQGEKKVTLTAEMKGGDANMLMMAPMWLFADAPARPVPPAQAMPVKGGGAKVQIIGAGARKGTVKVQVKAGGGGAVNVTNVKVNTAKKVPATQPAEQ